VPTKQWQVSGAPHNLYLPRPARIVRVRQETPTEKTLVLELADGGPYDLVPGQFAMVSVFGAGEIPLGITSAPSESTSGSLAGAIRGDKPRPGCTSLAGLTIWACAGRWARASR